MRYSVLTIFMLSAIAATAQTHTRFTATVLGGRPYTHALPDGLVFFLEPFDEGDWQFEIKPNAASNINFADCVTGPLHGPRNIDLLAWRYAPGNDPGYTEHVPGEFAFDFTTNAADNRYECTEAARVAEDVRQAKDSIGLPNYHARPRGTARIFLGEVKLAPDRQGQDARFVQITFTVDITLPKTATVKRNR